MTSPVVVHLRDVKATSIDWLWPGRLPLGKLSLIVGDPGLGKSFVTLDIAARVSAGGGWPDGGVTGGNDVVILSAEDEPSDTIRPRIDVQKGDPDRIWVLQGIRQGDTERHFNLAVDIDNLATVIHDTGASLVVIDPLSAYLGGIDSFKDSDVRSVLMPLSKLAESSHCAILGVMHLNKSSQQHAIYRASGSIAFVGTARVAFIVVADPHNEGDRFLAPLKINVAAPPPVMRFRINGQRLVWTGLNEKVDIQSILSGQSGEGREEGNREAEVFLMTLLTAGPVVSEDIMVQAKENGFNRNDMFAAKRALGVIAERIGGLAGKGVWVWKVSEEG